MRLYPSLFSLPPPTLGDDAAALQHFVLTALDVLASSVDVDTALLNEAPLAKSLDALLSQRVAAVDGPFRDALLAKWTSPGVAAARRAHGTMAKSGGGGQLQPSTQAQQASTLLSCALPGCHRREACAREFNVCAACLAAPYCCEEHGVQHWRDAHHTSCAGRRTDTGCGAGDVTK